MSWLEPFGVHAGWWVGAAAGLHNPKTRKATIHVGSFSARVAWNMSRAAFTTTLIRGGSMTVGAAGAQAAAAVAIPVIMGYGISHLIAGEEGRDDYTDFMSGRVSPGQWWDAVTLKSMR